MKEHLAQIEKAIRRFRFTGKPRSLYDPIHYIMALGGKRIRPLLTLLSYSLYRSNTQEVVKYAAAVEAFHNFTLIHDDIMDRAPIRRGKPTVHVKWNTNTAILSGDVMLVKVYDQFLDLEPARMKEILSLFNVCATEVCEGQQLDMEFETMNRVSEKQYLHMISLKTAALLGFSLELGAVLADAPAADRKLLRDFGINLGIAFQLRDDLLDAYGDDKKFGKLQGGDIIANKKTLLLIRAQRLARGKQGAELNRWLRARKFDKQKKVKEVKAIYDSLGVRKLVEEEIKDYLSRANQSLDKLTVRDKTLGLWSLVGALAGRQE